MHNFVPVYIDLAIIFAMSVFGFVINYRTAFLIENENNAIARPRPSYFGWWSLLCVMLPSLVICLGLHFASSYYIKGQIFSYLQGQESKLDVNQRAAASSEIVASPLLLLKIKSQLVSSSASDLYSVVSDFYAKNNINLPLLGDNSVVKAAFVWQDYKQKFSLFTFFITICSTIICLFISKRQIKVQSKIRSKIEKVVYYILQLAAILAIITTCAIVFSLIFQTWHFFEIVPLRNFFMNIVWDPRFAGTGSGTSAGQFGIWPLMLGTLYIASIAMLVATPIGLLAAIYMCEYAKPSCRSVIKLLLEVLAGIPTIVYGFFALLVVGPLLRDLSAYFYGGEPFIMAQSVLTAGLVIGIMLIPFVSSLTDDALKAVPKSLRYCSYGLGATQSETIKKVVFPAALPGIVGALLLSASRAIGETMIVVLAAGVAPNLTLNPFQAMTTITVKIVNQLTGDTEFNSPQTLVAFALGMTLFIFTLLLNVLALYIVRKYRNQYE